MIKTILVPVDGSDHADRAVELAADLAAKYGATLELYHVLLVGQNVPEEIRQLSDKDGYEEPALAVGGGFVEASLPRAVLEDIAVELLERAHKRADEHGAKNVKSAWGQGPTTDQILGRAKEVGADMIVMGSRGLSDLKGLVVGSVSHKISHLFEGTVVTVK